MRQPFASCNEMQQTLENARALWSIERVIVGVNKHGFQGLVATQFMMENYIIPQLYIETIL